MTSFATRSEPAATLFMARQRDRRQILEQVLSSVSRTIERREDLTLMRTALEDALRRSMPIRTAQLRDPGSRWSARVDPAPGVEAIAYEVPGAEPAGSGILEATFDPGCPLGDWDFQVLGLAAHIGALVLEIERTRVQLARAGLLTIGREHRDGAAPLIGSTPAMQALRATIERVAATDFTLLLEGARSR